MRVFESDDIPFTIKRVFTITSAKGANAVNMPIKDVTNP